MRIHTNQRLSWAIKEVVMTYLTPSSEQSVKKEAGQASSDVIGNVSPSSVKFYFFSFNFLTVNGG